MEIVLEGQPYKVISYCLCACYVTEIESPTSGEIIARGFSQTPGRSESNAVEKALAHIQKQRIRSFDLTVGG
jgi:hypothetical protein